MNIIYPCVISGNYAFPFVWFFMPMWHAAVIMVGLCVGSFINVLIWRLPREENVAFTPSHCPKCGKTVAWYENIPVVSYLALGGHCSGCGLPISCRYALVEVLTGVLFWLVWWRILQRHQTLAAAFPSFLLTSILVSAVFIDIKHYIIPDELTFPCMAAGLGFAFAFPSIWGFTQGGFLARGLAVSNSAAGLVAGGGIMAAMALLGRAIFKQDALGWGDVKLVAAIGACFGLAPAAWFFTILFGSLFGAAVGMALVIIGRGKLKTAIPFGPFLALAAYIWMLYGPEMSRAYFAWSRSVLTR